MSSATAARVSRKIQQFTNGVNAVRTGAASRPLPAQISQLRFQYQKLKGNAGVRHFVEESLPGIRFANPALSVSVLSAPPSTASSSSSSDATISPEPSTSELSASSDSVPNSWEATPGVFISFKDEALSEVFLPLSKGRSEEIGRLFWKTVEDPKALSALRPPVPS